MKKIFVAVLGVVFMVNAHTADKYNVGNLPPSVVTTFPIAGDTNVDPSTREIKVTFSKDMMTEEQWSWVIFSKDTFPKIVGKIKFIDKRTCVAPVKLGFRETNYHYVRQ